MNGNLRSYAVLVILVVLCLFHLLVSLMMSVVVFSGLLLVCNKVLRQTEKNFFLIDYTRAAGWNTKK